MNDSLRALLRRTDQVVFVCSGNMVRSAFAELWARHRGCPRSVTSCATTYRNDRLFPDTEQALLERGVSPALVDGFRPRHASDVWRSWSRDCVLFGMTRAHLSALAEYGDLAERGFLLNELRGKDVEIADPVLEGASFARTFDTVERCVDVLCENELWSER